MLDELRESGFTLVRGHADAAAAEELRALYDDDALFRKRIVMERHAYGRGEYKYFANPLPARVQALRERLYAALVPLANEWMRDLKSDVTFPATHQQFLHDCFESEQKRPTALLLKYGAGDFNCLHQDIYGPVAFPFQATLYLSRPGEEFRGGEVVLTEQRPRAQSRAYALVPEQGDLLILPSRLAPRRGANGAYRVAFRHGVSTVTWGTRFALGLIFHDAL
ncbi:MAG TPA: 2OG-Fe(II) oxygenase [Candidatus Acidoferrales bacterium]|nr:2OG-Fe(II) oxygenase [Candidatus Acidoferrales bacterium]